MWFWEKHSIDLSSFNTKVVPYSNQLQLKDVKKVWVIIPNKDNINNLYIKVNRYIGCGNFAVNLVYVKPNLSSKISIIPFILNGILINTIPAAI